MLISNRIFVAQQITAPSEPLLFRNLIGEERLSELYELNVGLLCPQNTLDLKSLLSKSFTVEINDQAAPTRYLNGNITGMTLSGQEESGERYYIYNATLRPTLWYLTQNQDCRIFQEQTVPEIILSVLSEYKINVDNRLSYNYRPWGYCVQYQESDYDFISRLMEHEGIYFYFTHQADGHTMVLADAPQGHDTMSGYDSIVYRLTRGGLTEDITTIYEWKVSDVITPSLYSLDDYDFRKPRANLLENRRNPLSFAKEKAEIFDWPGCYTDQGHGQFYARVRQQEFESNHETMQGQATSLGVAPGYRFMLDNAPRAEDAREYMTVAARYFFQENSYSSGDEIETEHNIAFEVVPADTQWRPARKTSWPKTNGPQTAEVVGPDGESIWTDKYGRVKLKFRWDRYSRGDETSSCWVRVSSNWAGWQYGGVQVPRVGEEVVVDFINGDPDRPMITGRVYNEDNMPPWDLPANATRMGIMSRTKDGNIANANSLFLEDSPGIESFDMHAEKDMNISIEDNFDILVQGNRTRMIEGTNTSTTNGPVTQVMNSTLTSTVQGPATQLFNSTLTTTVATVLTMIAPTMMIQPTTNMISITPDSLEATLIKVFAAGARVQAIGADIRARGAHIDSTQFEAKINPAFLWVTTAKILVDSTVLKIFKQQINIGKLELNAKDLVVYL
ncbi:type VI secretion system Vgr family protein [Enterobacillus tribolii]|uniref:Type VI secretion system secreted protein VgrG n=1 Tax=Enterobacillus tribolii TaxID=1487935 RepID=A0A370QS92_9GAMM|nr:type VI secretion system tip protein TssI/VgrG [Enterobacillus tribolii]MBW7983721.1 type VI secretion system tip protein VgrG [Enterobacillus tribolii]RDK92085.1 type VI secretion system secreted protein VgrG [Enterobacillus tribolii]